MEHSQLVKRAVARLRDKINRRETNLDLDALKDMLCEMDALLVERDHWKGKFLDLRDAVEVVLNDWANENVIRCDSRERVHRILNSVASV